MNKLILAIAASLVAVGAAQAQTLTPSAAAAAASFTPHAYVGVGAAIADNQLSDDYRVTPKIFGGYEFTPNWGIEAGYTYFNTRDRSWGVFNGIDTSISVKGYSSYVAGKYTIPVTDRFAAYGKLGVSHSERKSSSNEWGSYTERDTGLYGGLGVQYKLNEHVSAIGEYERYGKDKQSGAKADVITVGLKYGF